jgi:ABC-type cobalamin/Fe3+-siderophores transport system ATPase subunit
LEILKKVKSFEQVQPDHMHTFLHDIELAIELKQSIYVMVIQQLVEKSKPMEVLLPIRLT